MRGIGHSLAVHGIEDILFRRCLDLTDASSILHERQLNLHIPLASLEERTEFAFREIALNAAQTGVTVGVRAIQKADVLLAVATGRPFT